MLDQTIERNSIAAVVPPAHLEPVPRRRRSLREKFRARVNQDGMSTAIYDVSSYLLRRLGIAEPVEKRHAILNQRLDRLLSSTVAYGPLKGFKFSPDTWWSKRERGNILLGLYERDLLASLLTVPKSYETFIDLGAADGYYGIGVIAAGLFGRSVCFEASESGRQVIAKNARLNHVEGRTAIYGMADANFYRDLNVNLAASVLFVDIEGGEFSLFTPDVFEAFRRSVIFVEMHDLFYENDRELMANFKARASELFTVTEIRTSARDLSGPSRACRLVRYGSVANLLRRPRAVDDMVQARPSCLSYYGSEGQTCAPLCAELVGPTQSEGGRTL